MSSGPASKPTKPLPLLIPAPCKHKIMKDIQFEIAKLTLKPTDNLVVKLTENITMVERENLLILFKKIIPNNQVLIIQKDIDLTILEQEKQ